MCVLLCQPLLVIIFLFRVVREIPVRSMEDYKNGGCGWGRGLLPGNDCCISFDVFFFSFQILISLKVIPLGDPRLPL